MTTAAADSQTPVIYAAISDPESAELTGIDYVTGTSDALDTKFILDMMFAADPDIQTVGLLYSNSEPNSETPIEEAKAYLDEKGIAYVEATGNTNDEVLSAAANLADKADAVFTPTDNVVDGGSCRVSRDPGPRRACPITPAPTALLPPARWPPAASTTPTWAPRPPIWPGCAADRYRARIPCDGRRHHHRQHRNRRSPGHRSQRLHLPGRHPEGSRHRGGIIPYLQRQAAHADKALLLPLSNYFPER